MMRWLLLVFAFLVWPAVADVRDADTHFFMQNMGNFKEELATAQAEGKQGVLVMFELDDCPFCSRMKANILNQTKVQDYYRKQFLIYPVNVKGDTPMVDFNGKETTEKAFSLEQRARATPVFVFFDLQGNPVTRFTGAMQTADEFLLLGRYVVEGAYKSSPFNVYKRQHKSP
jgi:thioredoxin-related protein